MKVEGTILLFALLGASSATECSNVSVDSLANELRRSTCLLRLNGTALDVFRETLFAKHGASPSTIIPAEYVNIFVFDTTPINVTCRTSCPQNETANITWCIDIISTDLDVETCITLGGDEQASTNSTCKAERVGIPNSLIFPSDCPEFGCLSLVNIDWFYHKALLTCTVETNNCSSSSFTMIWGKEKPTIDYSYILDKFPSSPIIIQPGENLIIHAEVNYPDISTVFVNWRHGKLTYDDFIYEDPYCIDGLQECQNDNSSNAANLQTERIKAYLYLPNLPYECVSSLKSYLIVENVTHDDEGLYLLERTSSYIQGALYSTNTISVIIETSTVVLSPSCSLEDCSMTLSKLTDVASTTSDPSPPVNPRRGSCTGQHCSTGGISTGGAAAIGVTIVSITFAITSLSVILLCFQMNKKKRRRFCVWYYRRRLQARELPLIPQQPAIVLLTQLKDELQGKNMLFPKHHLQLGSIIGEGASGLVYRGYTSSGKPVAIKVGKILASENDKEKLLKEVSIMLPLKHPNVMSLVGLCFDGDVPLVILPYMSDGSVMDYVKENKDRFYITNSSSEENIVDARKKCLDMCHQIAKGMDYLARNHFIHRDLAARNCMIDGLANGVIKVADFGLAEDMYGTNYYRRSRSEGEERIPVRWMAPESIKTNIFSEASDVWSFGVTCWEVFTCGAVPYSGVPAMTILMELNSGHRLERPRNITCSDEIWGVMEQCWVPEPKQRPTFGNLVTQFFNIMDSDTAYIKL